MRVIRRFARQVAERFHPEKIILFGSYAYGTPHEDSDVDILVVMPARKQIDQAVRIDRAIEPPFPRPHRADAEEPTVAPGGRRFVSAGDRDTRQSPV
jgi:predicted nucleotidyltransferase